MRVSELDDAEKEALLNVVIERARADLNDGKPLTEMRPASYRTKFIDQDTHRQPKTDRYCVRCQRDIAPESPARSIHLVDGGPFALHPADESLYAEQCIKAGDVGVFLVGFDCAKRIGLEWTRGA